MFWSITSTSILIWSYSSCYHESHLLVGSVEDFRELIFWYWVFVKLLLCWITFWIQFSVTILTMLRHFLAPLSSNPWPRHRSKLPNLKDICNTGAPGFLSYQRIIYLKFKDQTRLNLDSLIKKHTNKQKTPVTDKETRKDRYRIQETLLTFQMQM